MARIIKDISKGLECKPIPCEPDCSFSQPYYPENFRYITRNIPGPGVDVGLFEGKLSGCQCQPSCQEKICPCFNCFGLAYQSQTGQLSPDAVRSSCLKPVVECNSQCVCDASCPSRVVQKGLRIKLTVAPSGNRGFGLFACEDILRLTFVCEYAGEVVGVSEAQERLKKGEGGMNYLIVLREHCSSGVILTCVDPRLMGNAGRFANHSCDPNLLMVPVRVDNSVPRLALFARKNITAGEELTFDYSGETVLEHSNLPDVDTGLLKTDSSEETSKLYNNLNSLVKPHSSESVDTFSEEISQGHSDLSHVEGGIMTSDSGEEMTLKFADSFDRTVKPSNKLLKKTVMSNSDMHQAVELQTTYLSSQHNKLVHDDSEEVSAIDTNLECRTDRQLNTVSDLTCCANTRKRKLSDNEGERHFKDASPTTKPNREPVKSNRKPCLCGSQSCIGYLPFDSLVLDS